jgi:tetratricopeptide (TPR) repeat protein
MLDPNIEQTQPSKPEAPAQITPPVELPDEPLGETIRLNVSEKPKKIRRWPIILGGILLVLLLGAVGGYLGYMSAVNARAQSASDQTTKVATEQFMLGVQAQASGNHNLAIRHFEYVIKLDANFPGVKDKLAQSMLALALVRTPTLTPMVILPTPTIAFTPTPDLRGEDDIFNNAKSLLANKEWGKALEVLDTLRNKNIKYRPVEVDGMYYLALRYQGMLSINQGRLETGLYQLALVERFAPLDVDANGLRVWARMYLSGASYWGVRWDKVIDIFGQIYPYYPNLRDLLGVTAAERFRLGSIYYGDQLAGQDKHCDAYDQYKNAQKLVKDAAVEPKMAASFRICYPPTNTPGPTATPTTTPTKTLAATKPVVLPSATTEATVNTPAPSNTPGASTPINTPVPPTATTGPTATEAAPSTPTPTPTSTPTTKP